MLKKWFKIIWCCSLIFLLLPFATSMIPDIIQTDDTKPSITICNDPVNDNSAQPNGIDVPDEEQTHTLAQTRARAPRAVDVKDMPTEPIGTISSSGVPISGSVKRNEYNWFRTPLFNPPLDNAMNITVKPESPVAPSSSSNWVHVRIYVHADFNANNDFDDGEMILLHQESYRSSTSSSVTCWALSSYVGFYYICVEGRPTSSTTVMTYSFKVSWTIESLPTEMYMNHNMKNAREVLPHSIVRDEKVKTDSRTFRWYYITAPNDTRLLGVNVSLKLKIDYSPPKLMDSQSVFVKELRAVIIHRLEDNSLVYGGMANASDDKETNLNENLFLYSIINKNAHNNKKVLYSYVGVFIASYGIDLSNSERRYHDGSTSSDKEDDAINSYLHFSFVRIESKPNIQPELSFVRVESTRTHNEYGQRNDLFRYHVRYVSSANYPPVRLKLIILRESGAIDVKKLCIKRSSKGFI